MCCGLPADYGPLGNCVSHELNRPRRSVGRWRSSTAEAVAHKRPPDPTRLGVARGTTRDPPAPEPTVTRRWAACWNPSRTRPFTTHLTAGTYVSVGLATIEQQCRRQDQEDHGPREGSPLAGLPMTTQARRHVAVLFAYLIHLSTEPGPVGLRPLARGAAAVHR